MYLVAFLGGALTLFSPCVLPVLPLLFSRSGGPAWAPLLTLAGLASGFAVLASMAVVSSEWVIHASVWGRNLALVLLAVSALALLSSRFGSCVSRPWLWLGGRLHGAARCLPPAVAAWLIGFAAGLLWAPCAGPILGLIMSGAMLNGPSVSSSLLLLCFGFGSAVAMGALIFLGRGAFQRAKLALRTVERLRRGSGALALLAVVGISTGLTDRLAGVGNSRLAAELEHQVIDGVSVLVERLVNNTPVEGGRHLPDLGAMPSLDGASQWLNSPPLSNEQLRGKVVLVDFWTFDCINCRNSLPYVNQWAQRYADKGLVVIGVHTPEYAFERIIDNVREATVRLGVKHPVAIDNEYSIWNAFTNQYWPAHYFVDANGRVRHLHIGEGNYEEQEAIIQRLLQERDAPGKGASAT